MRETFIPFLCLIAFAINSGGCGPKAHVEDRLDNVGKAAEYRAAVEKCVDEAIRIIAVDQDDDKAEAYYKQCKANADDKFNRK